MFEMIIAKGRKIKEDYQATKRHGGTLHSHCQVKEANLKGLHAVRFQVSDILEKAKLRRVKRSVVAKCSVGGRNEQVEHRGFLGQ